MIDPPLEKVSSNIADAKPTKQFKPKQNGMRDADLKDLPVKVIEHTRSEDELALGVICGYTIL